MKRQQDKEKKKSVIPPLELRILDLNLEQLDQNRFRCIVTITETAAKPDLIIELVDVEGKRLASITVLETPDSINKYVLHTAETPIENVNLIAYLKDDEFGVIDHKQQLFTLDNN